MLLVKQRSCGMERVENSRDQEPKNGTRMALCARILLLPCDSSEFRKNAVTGSHSVVLDRPRSSNPERERNVRMRRAGQRERIWAGQIAVAAAESVERSELGRGCFVSHHWNERSGVRQSRLLLLLRCCS